MRCDCTAEPPGELMTSAIGLCFAEREGAIEHARDIGEREAGLERRRDADHAGQAHDRHDRAAAKTLGDDPVEKSRGRIFGCHATVISCAEPLLKLLLVNRFSPLSAAGSPVFAGVSVGVEAGDEETAVKPYVLLLLLLTIAVYADVYVKWSRRAG